MKHPVADYYLLDGTKTLIFDGVAKFEETIGLDIEDDPKNADGAQYVNCAKVAPDEIKMDILMSNVYTDKDVLTNGDANRSKSAFAYLVKLKDNRTLVTLVTKNFTYNNLLIKSCVTAQDETNPWGITAALTLHQATEKTSTSNKNTTNSSNTSNSGTTSSNSFLFDMYGHIW